MRADQIRNQKHPAPGYASGPFTTFSSVFYFLVRYIRSEKPVWIFWLMFAFIIGMYNKYNIVFLLIGLLGCILLTDKRKILINKYFYISLLLGLLLLLPNIIWQINNRFPVYHYRF